MINSVSTILLNHLFPANNEAVSKLAKSRKVEAALLWAAKLSMGYTPCKAADTKLANN